MKAKPSGDQAGASIRMIAKAPGGAEQLDNVLVLINAIALNVQSMSIKSNQFLELAVQTRIAEASGSATGTFVVMGSHIVQQRTLIWK